MSNDRKWIRLPGQGEVRGQGSWHLVRDGKIANDWDRATRNFSYPVAREFQDREQESSDKLPAFVIEGGWLIYPFHNVGVKLAGGDQHSLRAAHQQLQNLLETVLIIEGKANATS